MTQEKFSQKILEKIQDKSIKPTPKWEVLLKEYGVWVLLMICFIVGSMANSVVIYMIDNNEWDLHEHISDSLLAFIFVTLPYFWLIILLVFISLIYFNFKHTRSGYKYHSYTIILSSILLSIILGLIFYNIGLSATIDDVFAKNVSVYNDLEKRHQKIFMQPEKGVLVGMVLESSEKKEFILIDFVNQKWVVINEVVEPNHQILIAGNKLIVVGEQIEKSVFKAKYIRPLNVGTGRWLKMQGMPRGINMMGERKLLEMRINN